MVVAAALVNPHLIVYDATVLVLPLIWLSAHHIAQTHVSSTYWTVVYGLFVTLFAPTALLIGLQLSVVLLIWLFMYATRSVTTFAECSGQTPHLVSAMANSTV